MDEIIEAILDLILEGSLELSSNKKVPKWIRYPLIVFLVLFFSIIILGMLVIGILSLKENIYISIILITLSIALLIGSIYKFRKVYLKKDETV